MFSPISIVSIEDGAIFTICKFAFLRYVRGEGLPQEPQRVDSLPVQIYFYLAERPAFSPSWLNSEILLEILSVADVVR